MLQTVSSLLTHLRNIEEALIEAYRVLQEDGASEFYIKLATEHKWEREDVERTYREAVSDAYSVAFLPKPLDETNYKVENMNVRQLELLLQRYAHDASKAVMEQLPEVGHVLQLVSKKSGKRIEQLNR